MDWRDVVAQRNQQQSNIQPQSNQTADWRTLVEEKKRTEKLSSEMTHPDISKGWDPAETRAAKEFPEIGSGGLLSGEDKTTTAKIAPILLTTTNPQEMADILSKNYPHIKIQQDEGLNWIASNTKNGVRVVLNKPGLSKLDLMQGLGLASLFTPSSKVATLGTSGVKASGAVAARQGLQGAGASMLTESVIQAAQQQAGGEFNAGDVLLSGGLGFAADAGFPAYQALKQTRLANKLKAARSELDDVLPAFKEAEKATEGLKNITDIDFRLFPAQKTTSQSLLEKQSFVASMTPGARQSRNQLIQQNKEAAQIVDSLLDKIAPADAVVKGSRNIRTVAQNELERLLNLREQKSSVLYTNAMTTAKQSRINVDVKDIIQSIDEQLKTAPNGGMMKRQLEKVKGMMTSEVDDLGLGSNFQRLHNAKLELDNLIDGPAGNSLDNTIKRRLMGIKAPLMEKLKTSNPAYKQAAETFEKYSPAINEYEQSLMGSITKLNDKDLYTVSDKLFNPRYNAQTVKAAKDTVNDPDIWNQIVRTEIEKRLGSVKGDLMKIAKAETFTVENIPGQLHRAIFGNQKQKKILMAALDEEQKKTFDFLDVALKRASLGRPGGSQTATREEIKKELRGGVVQGIRNFIQHPIQSVSGIGEETMFNTRVRAMAEMLYNPRWRPEIKEISSKGLGSSEAGQKMFNLLSGIEAELRASIRPIPMMYMQDNQ